MKLHSGTANIMSMDNSIEYTVGSTSYKNQSLGVGNWYIPMTDAGGCEHFKLQGSGSITNHFQFLQSFNTSTVSNFERTFYDLGKFNEDVSMFNTSNATMMRYMFSGCREFNKSIDNFDTSNVENFYRFMYECRKFNQPILNLDTSKGRTFYRWFYNCREFNQHINHLDFSSVPNYDENNSSPSHEGFNYAFGKCVTLNQDITGITYNTHPYLVQTFAECWNMNHPGLESKVPFPPEARTSGPSREWTNCRINIANWTQPLPYICDQLFSGWKYFNQPVDHLDFTNCEVISGTFSNAQSFNHPSVANWDFTSAPKLTDVSRTFNSTTNFDIEAINQWNMTNIKGVRSMFKGSKAGTTNKGYFNLESWDMSNVLYMDNMFESSNIVKGISTWNTTNVLVTCQMFQNSIVSDDLSGWDVSNVFRATNMFRNWGAENPDRFKNWGYNTFDCNISNWNPKNISEFKNAFCNITSPNGYSSLSKLDLWRWRLPRIEYSHKINNDTWAADNWRDPWSDSYFESSPCFNMKVIEPGYEPVLTIRTAKMNDSNNSYIHIFGGDLHTSKEVLTYSRSSSRPLSLNNQNDIVIDVFKSSNVACTGGWIQFSGGSGSYWNENWEFAEAFGPHPELVNKPPAQFKHPFGGGDKSSVIQNVGGFEHLDVSDLTDLSVFFDLHYGSTSSNFGKVNIENWDVSNATNMDYFFGGRTNSSRMTNVTTGDLSYWCVQGVTSKPTLWPGRREDIVEKDPLWGQCPTPGSPLRPELPDGEWNIYQNVLWIESDDDATQTNDIIKLIDWYGWKPDAWARAREDRYSGWSDWESLGAVQYIIPDFRIEYIVAFNNPFRLKGDSGMNNINFINVKLSNQTNMRNMLLNLREFNSDISYWDVSNTTDMSNMFRNCKAFNQDLSGWDTRKVTNTRYYDYGCNNWDLNYRPF
jgi:surface protein